MAQALKGDARRAELVVDQNEAAELARAIESRAAPAPPPGRLLGAVAGAAVGAAVAALGWGMVARLAGTRLDMMVIVVGVLAGIGARKGGGVGRSNQIAAVGAAVAGVALGFTLAVRAVHDVLLSPVDLAFVLRGTLDGFDLLIAAFALYQAWKIPARG